MRRGTGGATAGRTSRGSAARSTTAQTTAWMEARAWAHLWVSHLQRSESWFLPACCAKYFTSDPVSVAAHSSFAFFEHLPDCCLWCYRLKVLQNSLYSALSRKQTCWEKLSTGTFRYFQFWVTCPFPPCTLTRCTMAFSCICLPLNFHAFLASAEMCHITSASSALLSLMLPSNRPQISTFPPVKVSVHALLLPGAAGSTSQFSECIWMCSDDSGGIESGYMSFIKYAFLDLQACSSLSHHRVVPTTSSFPFVIKIKKRIH